MELKNLLAEPGATERALTLMTMSELAALISSADARLQAMAVQAMAAPLGHNRNTGGAGAGGGDLLGGSGGGAFGGQAAGGGMFCSIAL